MKSLLISTGVFVVYALLTGAVAADGEDVAARRARVNAVAAQGTAGLAELSAALSDDNALVRRAAVRALVNLGDPAREALTAALVLDDPVVQRTALLALARDGGAEALPHLARALESRDPIVRETAVRFLVGVDPRGEEATALLRKAATDEAPDVQRAALSALSPFSPEDREVVLLRDRPDMADHVERVEAVHAQPLPHDGWRFREDRGLAGHVERWFDADFDDSDWAPARIAEHWAVGYIGVGWYRRWIELPERPEHLSVELAFEGVDEGAWVWVNGVYVGGHDIGPGGWNVPFRLDITSDVRWGERNQITVRAMNTGGGGGIWKPVTIEALGFRR